MAERAQEQHELFELTFVRPFVYAVQARDAALVDPLRGFDVRRDHAFFDDLVRHEPLDGADAFYLAALVELDLRLRQVEVDGAATLAHAGESLVDGIQVL